MPSKSSKRKTLDDIFLDDFDEKEVFGTIADKSEQATYQEDSETLISDEEFLEKAMQLLGIKKTHDANVYAIPIKDNKQHVPMLQQSYKNLDKELKLENSKNLQLTCDIDKIHFCHRAGTQR